MNTYPLRIRLSARAETYISMLVDDLIVGNVELYQLPTPLADLYNLGHHQGVASIQPLLDQARWDADRYYAEMCRRRPVPYPDGPSFATLQQRRRDMYELRAEEMQQAKGRA
ncbi:hypothetical protein [Microcella sp.]|uniref:hypothetical protein n=1 Tax=Microcella sp. TaxID=1913979 RepID=UPI00391D4184